jgi:agmatine deiminase
MANTSTPRELGLRMPAETDPHERTVMAWPTELRRQFWEGHLEEAREAWATVAIAIGRFEPVTMVVDTGELPTAEALLGDVAGVDLVELPIDDSWTRDTGPIVVTDPEDASRRIAVHFGFNAWGDLVRPWDDDAAVGAAVGEHLGLEVLTAPFVFEGGAIAVDGAGLAVTTERCLLNPNRGPRPGGLPRAAAALDALLADWLGATTVVWLTDGLADDDDTDGHVDNVVSIPRPGVALLQGCEDPDDPDAATAAESRRRLAAAGLDVVELSALPRTVCFGREVEVPYLNLYAGNGFVIVPVCGHSFDDEALDLVGSAYPGREVVPVPGAVIAFGGGGPHCITQQVPSASREPSPDPSHATSA